MRADYVDEDCERTCELFPAIDLLDGNFVRLAQGDYERRTIYGDRPELVVEQFIQAGALWVHVVDLNGARGEGPVNRDLIGRLTSVASGGGAKIQTGGGVRTREDAAALFEAGVSRVVVGTAAVKNPTVIAEIASLRGGEIAVGLDAHLRDPGVDGAHQAYGQWEVAVQGWTESSGQTLFGVLESAIRHGANAVVATDIARDGMLTGPSISLYADLLRFRSDTLTKFDVIASGGVSGIDDVALLAAMPGLDGVIAGRAIYDGLLDVEDAVRVCRGR